MDIKNSCCLFVLLSAVYLASASAETATPPPVIAPESEVPAPQAPDATPEVQTAAEVWNNSAGAIQVTQIGQAQEKIEKGQHYQSQSYPQKPISIQIPADNRIKYITVTGQKGKCTVPICIIVQ